MGWIVKANFILANTLPVACRWAAPRRRIGEEVVTACAGKPLVRMNGPIALRPGLLLEGFRELPIQVQHLPRIHRDPFDRLLVAQEVLGLPTAERTLQGYGETVGRVGGWVMEFIMHTPGNSRAMQRT